MFRNMHNRSRSVNRPYRPHLEELEARTVPTAAIGMNLENVYDFSPAWTFTDAFLKSRPWQPQAYNTVTQPLPENHSSQGRTLETRRYLEIVTKAGAPWNGQPRGLRMKYSTL